MSERLQAWIGLIIVTVLLVVVGYAMGSHRAFTTALSGDGTPSTVLFIGFTYALFIATVSLRAAIARRNRRRIELETPSVEEQRYHVLVAAIDAINEHRRAVIEERTVIDDQLTVLHHEERDRTLARLREAAEDEALWLHVIAATRAEFAVARVAYIAALNAAGRAEEIPAAVRGNTSADGSNIVRIGGTK